VVDERSPANEEPADHGVLDLRAASPVDDGRGGSGGKRRAHCAQWVASRTFSALQNGQKRMITDTVVPTARGPPVSRAATARAGPRVGPYPRAPPRYSSVRPTAK